MKTYKISGKDVNGKIFTIEYLMGELEMKSTIHLPIMNDVPECPFSWNGWEVEETKNGR